MADQFEEVSDSTNTNLGASWLRIGYTNDDGPLAWQEASGSAKIHSATDKTTYINSTHHTECYHADTSSNFRDISGATLYSTLAATEESPHEVSPRLGSSALVVQRQHPGTTMVAQEPQTMEWSIPSSFNARTYTLCRCQQHRKPRCPSTGEN
ncbi:hypothetical protein G6F62_013803 [Rhizopus arrhizus]|nr:hypothetical protein G6F62_013803 [Rhizopus arrhizus]